MSRARAAKIQRWMDLLVALLRRRYGAAFDELLREVPAYADAPGRATLMRMFERDKGELRAFGVAVETVPGNDGEPAGYVLRRQDFYLPYVVVQQSLGAERPGYRDLPRVVLDPDELEAIRDAALLVRQLGDAGLAADAESAIRKLTFDLPPGALVIAPRGTPCRGCQGPPV